MGVIESKRWQYRVDDLAEYRLSPHVLLALDPNPKGLRNFPHIQPPVEGFLENRHSVADRTPRIDKLGRLITHTAAFTLIAVCVQVIALRVRTLSADETIL